MPTNLHISIIMCIKFLGEETEIGPHTFLKRINTSRVKNKPVLKKKLMMHLFH